MFSTLDSRLNPCLMSKFNNLGLIKLCIFLLCMGAMSYYIYNQPDCIKMTVGGSVRCSCDFASRGDWNKFKADTKGLNGDGWQYVTLSSDPCKKVESSETTSSNSNSQPSNMITDGRVDNYNPEQPSIQNSQPAQPKIDETPQTETKRSIDSVALIQHFSTREKWGDYLSDKLPLSYRYKDLKFTFKKPDTILMVDCYNSSGLYKTFSCKQHDNVITLANSNMFFAMNEGMLYLIDPQQHTRMQLSMDK